MKLIVGLGNPGSKYEDTRHNVGFSYLDCLAKKHFIRMKKLECRALTGIGRISGQEVLLAKPQTFMNLSGESVLSLCKKYGCDPGDVIVLFDDISLELGKLRIRKKGSAGGHNGIKSIIYQLQSDEFPRLKIGVGAPPNKEMDLADHVLGTFSKEELETMISLIPTVCDAVEMMLKDIDQAMNLYN
ncbi:MAG: aminoacyl-tRNA hydrolase [Clostridia bacterium]|nr:aminoacyl-tRNA hydrolase [Clostridia bacterium]